MAMTFSPLLAYNGGRARCPSLIGSTIAAPAGLVMGSVHFVRTIFDPYAQFFCFVPSLAWITPVVLWFGSVEISKKY